MLSSALANAVASRESALTRGRRDGLGWTLPSGRTHTVTPRPYPA